jgi:hypothetical protein
MVSKDNWPMVADTFPSHIRSVTSGLFLFLVFVVVSLPTGSILGLNVKVVVFGGFLAAFTLYLISTRDELSRGEVTFFSVVGGFLCFWSLIGALNGQANSGQIFYQLREVTSAILIAWLSIFLIRRGLFRPENLITAVIYGILFLSAAKLALVVATIVSNIDAIEATRSVFGQESLVAGNMAFGLFRMEFSADILGAFALFGLLARSVSGIRFGRVLTSVIFVVVLGSGFIAYSRYIWFIYLVSICTAIIVERSWKMLSVMVLAALLIGASSYDVISTVVQMRFQSDETDSSDIGRVEQARALINEIKARPILGKGMGAHANTYTSSDTHLYAYELQWLAFLMQFGLVGGMGILLLVAASARDLMAAKHPAKTWIFLLFLVWLLASWTNPYLTSSFAGATFGLFMAMFYRLRNITPNTGSPSMSLVPSFQPR